MLPPLRIHPEDIGEVITAFHDAKNGIKSNFDSKKDLSVTFLCI
jgi:hypothetical protein